MAHLVVGLKSKFIVAWGVCRHTRTGNTMTQLWRETLDSARNIRRQLHSNPELTWREINTCQRVRDTLSALHIPWRSCAELGTVATLHPGTGASDSPHIALRGDMDALPIDEKTGKPWASTVSGCMHACGHDGH